MAGELANPNSQPTPDHFQSNFELDAEEICTKFIHSLNLFSALKVGVVDDPCFHNFSYPDKVNLVLVLVIKNHQEGWCIPVQKKLNAILPDYIKRIWKPKVFVMNREIATKYHLVASTD